MKTNRLILLFLIVGVLSVPSCNQPERRMLVETGNVSNILTTTADVSGTIFDTGEGATQHGHCYGITEGPTVSGTKTTLGVAAKGDFTSNLAGLQPSTEYYVRAYTSLGTETAYGSEITFTTASAALAELTTTVITSITKTSAISGGNITSEGGTLVTARGVCWNVASGPTIDNNKTTDGSGSGSFVSSITGLSANTVYYVRAYASNSGGTQYGNEISFTTSPEVVVAPTVTTAEVTSVTSNSAVSGGNVTNEGGAPVTAKGVCWSTSQTPTTNDSHTSDGTGSGTFTSNIVGLTGNTTYYARAYASNSVGTAYGNELSFKTGAIVPSLTTAAVTLITSTTATSGGEISADGGSSVTAKGVCWSTSASPTTADFKTSDGSGTGSFASNLTGLSPNTAYYVRAYATNIAGAGYGNEISFITTSPVIPTLSTSAVTSITPTTAISGGNITSNGGAAVTASGVCWSTTANPVATDNHTTDGATTGTFTSSITGLIASTTYYVRAYATNSVGTAYGNEEIFTTLAAGGTITDYDGNVYKTITIGTQTWMAENLKTTHYADGTTLVDGTGVGDITGDYITKYWFIYQDHNLSNKDTYGLLYTWAAAMNGASSSDANPSGVQGVCPTGWHLPSDAEWKQLEMHLGMSQAEADRKGWRGTNEGGKLKETGTTLWLSPNTGATNESGFSALPGGYRYSGGPVFNLGYFGYWWTSTGDAFYRDLNFNLTSIYRYDTSKDWGFSVRCIKDK